MTGSNKGKDKTAKEMAADGTPGGAHEREAYERGMAGSPTRSAKPSLLRALLADFGLGFGVGSTGMVLVQASRVLLVPR